MTDTAATTQELVLAPADPRREYVAGAAHWLAYRGAVRSLPHAVDDLEAELGDDLYTRMLRDPRVAGDVGLLKARILSDSVTITPAVTPDGDDAAAAAAKAAADFVTRCLYNLTIPIEDVLRDQLDALAYGCKVAEQVYAPGEGEDANRLILKALKVKPRKATAFVVDAFLNVLGLLAPENGPAAGGMVVAGANDRVRVLPRSKFAVLTYGPKDSDPRGSTVLRASYNWWWIKTQLLPDLLKFGATFGTPSLVGNTEPNAQTDPDRPGLSPEDLLLEKLLAFQNGTALALPAEALVKILESARAGGETFFERITDLCDRQISIGIYGATRATQEAENGSKADSETAKNLLDDIVSAGRWSVAAMLQRDVVAPLLAYNDPAWAKWPPVISLGGITAEDRTPAWTAAAALERSGYLDPSQYPELDSQLGLPVRTPAEVEARRTRKSSAPTTTPPQAEQGQSGQADPNADPGANPNPDGGA